MSSIYEYPKGYKVRYRIYFADGSSQVKYKYSQKKSIANTIKEEAAQLEAVSKFKPSYDDLLFFVHQGFIVEEELFLITGLKKQKTASWADLTKQYETYSEASHTIANLRAVRSRLKNLDAYFKDIPIQDISAQKIIEWQATRQKDVAIKTVKLEKGILSQILDTAVEGGIVPVNPCYSRTLKGTLRIDKAGLPVALTYEEVQALFEAIKKNPKLLGGKISLATLICLFAGLRRGELCCLTYDDIRGSQIIIQSKDVSPGETKDPDTLKRGRWLPKGNRPRVIDLPLRVADEIKRLTAKREGRFIFGGGHVYHKDYITEEFERVLKPINPKLSLHCLRHTFVTWRIEHGLSGEGDNIVRVQQAAGHADIQTTMRYTHIKVSPEGDILDLV